MTLDDKVGQLLVSSFASEYMSTDSREFDALVKSVHDYQVGGFHVFGGTEPAPDVLLDANYGTVTLGQPLAAASLLNRLQAIAPYPLLNSADFETGAGFRLAGATAFPRNMAFGAAGDERLAYEAGRITAVESRAIGVQVNFAPVVDVNNNPRNPVINTRSYGEDPARVGRLGSAYVRGPAGRRDDRDAEALSRARRHRRRFASRPADHQGRARRRSMRTEFPPFKAGIAAGAGAVMTAHIEMPALDPAPNTPTTLSQPIVTGVLRRDMGFDGLIYTDSMGMAGVDRALQTGRRRRPRDQGGQRRRAALARRRARRLRGSRRRWSRARFPRAQLDKSVERDPARQGADRAAPHARRQSRRARRHRRRPRAPGRRRRGQPASRSRWSRDSGTRCR